MHIPFRSNGKPTELDDQLINRLTTNANVGPVLKVRPYADSPGYDDAADFMKSLYSDSGANADGTYSFEWHYDDQLTAWLSGPSLGTIKSTVDSQFANSRTTIVDQSQALPDCEPGEYLAGARLELTNDCVYPLTHMHSDHEPIDNDPYASLFAPITNDNDERVVIQGCFQPVSNRWFKRGRIGTGGDGIADSVSQGHLEHGLFNTKVVQSEFDDVLSSDMSEQAGKPAFRTTIRVVTIGPSPEAAQDRLEEVVAAFDDFDYGRKQSLRPVFLRGRDLRYEAHCLADRITLTSSRTRRFVSGSRQVLTKDEAGALFHFPNNEINISGVDWTHFDTGPSVPYGTPRYNFEAAGVPTDEATTAEQQLAMVDHPQHGDDAIWLGRGRNEGIEAGVFEEFLNAHIQITGRTRMGKTTLATNIGSQAMERGYGALAIMLGKEDDDEAFIAEWPEDRPQEDFVFIDTGDEFDQRVRFNLLEIPDHLEAGTAEHTSYMESLADDFCAAFAQAGGGEGTLYPLMRGITRTVVRGMAQSEMTCTPLDLAAACSSADNMQRFSQWMSDERIHFIKETAARFEEKEDADLEPIARRMDEIVQNGNLRTLLSARDPSTRIQEIVDEGKVAVLRIDEALGETERKFVTTPIVRRFAHAKKMSDNDDPYYCIWDEADKAVSSHSNLAQMLSEYGGYDFRFCLLYQAPSSQLPEDITNATESQIDTTISFRTTGKDARFIQHQHSVDADDLDRLPRYSFYMNTDTKRNDPTESYMVDAFPPIREVRQQVAGTDLLTDEAIIRMKRESAARYGGEPESAEEIKANSQFYTTSGGASSDGDENNTDENGSSDGAEQALYEAIYTVQIRHAAIGEYVDTAAIIDEWRRRVDDGELGFASEISNVIEQAPEEYIERQRRGGDTVLRLTPDGRKYAGLQQDTGSSASGGGNEHRWVLTQAYRAFTKLGLFVELPTQEGEEDPDGLAELPIDPMAGDDIREIHAREERLQEKYPYLAGLTDGMNISIEAETSTIKKPMQTLTNLRKAIDTHRLCVFACKDGSAEHDEFGYWARRGEQIIYDTTNGETDDDRLTFATEMDEQGNRRFYNTTSQFALGDGVYALRRDTGDETDLVWYEDGTEVVMSDDSGVEHARFESSAAVGDLSQEDVPAYYEYDADNEEYVVRAGGEKLYYATIEEMLSEWTRVYAPFIPDVEFERLPTPEDFLFVVFPDEDTEGYDEPMIYEQGDMRPLLPADIPWNATETPSDNADAAAAIETEQSLPETGPADARTESDHNSELSELSEAVMRSEEDSTVTAASDGRQGTQPAEERAIGQDPAVSDRADKADKADEATKSKGDSTQEAADESTESDGPSSITEAVERLSESE